MHSQIKSLALLIASVGLLGALSPLAAASPVSTPGRPSTASAPCTARVDVVDDLLAAGQQKLIAGDIAGALEAFNQAHGHTQGAARTEVWVLRAQMESGRKNDAMNRADMLEGKGELPAVDADYLRGTFAYLTAEELIAAGTRNANPMFHYQESREALGKALAAQPDAYPDAWRTLAWACRKADEGEAAEVAVRGALARLADDPRTNLLGAEVLVANHAAAVASEDEAVASAAKERVHEGIGLAERAVKLFGDDRKAAPSIASAHLQRGVAALWLGDKELAAGAYAAAIESDPTQVDFGSLWNSFQDVDQRPGPFVALLADGAARFERRWGKATNADSTLLWWLGFGEFTLAKYEGAEQHFIAAVEKFPAYANSWWYAGMCRYYRQDYAGAAQHWRQNWASSAENLVATVTSNLGQNDPILAYVEGKLMEAGDAATASFIAQVRCGASPTNDRVWNNLGLFCRDAGDNLKRSGKDGDDHKTVAEYYELANSAYERANELAPNKPYYLNDWAVILHYCLDRDHQRALEMYANATELAERMLKQGGLSDEEKGLVEIALRDSKNNRAQLVRLLENRKKKKPADGDGGGRE